MLLVQLRNTAINLGVYLGAFNLIQNGSVVGFIDAERLSAIGANEFVHTVLSKSAGMFSVDNAKVSNGCAVNLHSFKLSSNYAMKLPNEANKGRGVVVEEGLEFPLGEGFFFIEG